ncbi:MAG TPA: CPBP family glutamic-type intramembrane protease [Thermoanaerobaculia bacterium]|nr:CPBP family glutamic-type intramembrane protease [Thermoanaerobaculia bacterium]
MKRAFALLFGLGAIATLLSFPFPPPIPALLIAEVAVALLVLAGIHARARVGLDVPPTAKRLLLAFPIGVVLGGITLALLPLAGLQSRIIAEAAIPLWKRIVIAFDSSILEEIVFRLFIMTVVAWALSHVMPRNAAIWSGIIVAAIAFGAAHLTRWMAAGPMVIAAVMLVNGFIAIALAVIYRKWGIEAAIVAHFAGDVTAHVVGPYLFT